MSPAAPRWGTVSTIRAALPDIARFAAYHLDLGASRIDIYLDTPAPETQRFFAPFDAINITQCDAAYWAKKPKKAQRNHRLRQAYNATQCYRTSALDWLAHIDVDEFILSPRPLDHLLAAVPANADVARMRPAELLVQPDPWEGPVHFKLTRREAGHKSIVMEDIYPDTGAQVHQGFLSHTSGKIFARTGLPKSRLGIHHLIRNGEKSNAGHMLTDVHIGHAHAPSWQAFQHHLDFRLTQGSYRKTKPEQLELQDLFATLLASEGVSGLRRFFDQVCQATPDLLSRLAAHNLLLTAPLDLDEKVKRWFDVDPKELHQ